jgi:hypothetical protein
VAGDDTSTSSQDQPPTSLAGGLKNAIVIIAQTDKIRACELGFSSLFEMNRLARKVHLELFSQPRIRQIGYIHKYLNVQIGGWFKLLEYII